MKRVVSLALVCSLLLPNISFAKGMEYGANNTEEKTFIQNEDGTYSMTRNGIVRTVQKSSVRPRQKMRKLIMLRVIAI